MRHRQLQRQYPELHQRQQVEFSTQPEQPTWQLSQDNVLRSGYFPREQFETQFPFSAQLFRHAVQLVGEPVQFRQGQEHLQQVFERMQNPGGHELKQVELQSRGVEGQQAVHRVGREVQFRQLESQVPHEIVAMSEYIPWIVEQLSRHLPLLMNPVRQLQQKVALTQAKHLPTQIEHTYVPVRGQQYSGQVTLQELLQRKYPSMQLRHEVEELQVAQGAVQSIQVRLVETVQVPGAHMARQVLLVSQVQYELEHAQTHQSSWVQREDNRQEEQRVAVQTEQRLVHLMASKDTSATPMVDVDAKVRVLFRRIEVKETDRMSYISEAEEEQIEGSVLLEVQVIGDCVLRVRVQVGDDASMMQSLYLMVIEEAARLFSAKVILVPEQTGSMQVVTDPPANNP